MRIIGGEKRGTKLITLQGLETRPTLDRVKEALFSKINFAFFDSCVLDLFSGSGSLGLESISRGAKKAYLCDNSYKAINIIKKNTEKLGYSSKVKIINKDYEDALDFLKDMKVKLDIVFLDPPYKSNYSIKATNLIFKYKLLNKDGMIIIETDDKNKIVNELDSINIDIFDIKKYGKVNLIFLRRKEMN